MDDINELLKDWQKGRDKKKEKRENKQSYHDCEYYEACIFFQGWCTDAQSYTINETCAVACDYLILFYRSVLNVCTSYFVTLLY